MAAKATFPLYGYERFFAMQPTTSARLAYVMTLRGDVNALLAHLPTAVLMTFNQHPKMRAALLPGAAPQKAMICQPLVDAAELKGIYTCTWREREEENATEWKAFVERECGKAVNREQELPYSVHVFADKTSQRFARIVLLADHYMADATSGAIVLNALLQNAAKVSEQPVPAKVTDGASAPTPRVDELPLRPSLYECMHNTNRWLGIFNEAVAKWVIEPLFNFDHSGFTPVLPVDAATQHDYSGKPPTEPNASKACFATGTASNMQRALERCAQQGVSLHGALTAASILAFGMTQHKGNLRSAATAGTRIQLKTDVSCDMRGHISKKFAEDVVGLYSTAGNLVFTGSEGAEPSDSFWEIARRADQELLAMVDGHELKFQSMYVHETLHSESIESSLQVKNSVLSDTTLTNAGVYKYPQEISLRKDPKAAVTTALHVESLHVYNSLPSLSSASMLFLSGVSAFNYSMMSKLDERATRELFHWYVQSVEQLGAIGEEDSLLQASEKLERMAPTAAAKPTSAAITTPKPNASRTQQAQV